MSRYDVVRDRYEEGLHAGAGKSLKLTIGALQEYGDSGVLPRVGTHVDLRRTLNDLLKNCLRCAERRGAERERNRIASLLQMPVSQSDDGEFGDEAGGAVLLPHCHRRLAR